MPERYQPQRYTSVPWLWNSDLDEGQRALWEYDSTPNIDRTSCWQVKQYEQRSTQSGYLIVRAVRGNGNDGGRIALALSDRPHFDAYAKACFATTSNKKKRYVDADWWHEDGA